MGGGRGDRMIRCCDLSVELSGLEVTAAGLEAALAEGRWVRLLGPDVPAASWPGGALGDDWPPGPGLVLSSGGSSGGRSFCLHPIDHLDRSAAACGRWLKTVGVEPADALVWNPLPFQHVSGLMPWWRSRQWESDHVWLPPALMKAPETLLAHGRQRRDWTARPMVVSLVPTQLARLLDDPSGVTWLQAMTVIWVGGAALSTGLAERARQQRLRLAPCYGATETAAMVAVQSPEAFLSAEPGCGAPLDDVELSLDADDALLVRSPRLALARLRGDGALASLVDGQGWWRSGDAASLTTAADGLIRLSIRGRLDGAIHSGGVTVFPSQLEARLLVAAKTAGLPLEAVLFLGVRDREWGERLVALVRWLPDALDDAGMAGRLSASQALVADWLPAERPIAWYDCPELAPTAAGKWQRLRWQAWVQALEAGGMRPRDDNAV